MNHSHIIVWGIIPLFSVPIIAQNMPSNRGTCSLNPHFSHVAVLPYFKMNGDYCIALYKEQKTNSYAAIRGVRAANEKYTAQTAARIFFPLQQHKNIRTGTFDWHSPKHMANMIFRGPWARSYLLSMGNDTCMYVVDVQRLAALKKLQFHPMIIVKLEDLLQAIAPARVIDNFMEIKVADLQGNLFSIVEPFAHSLARGDNWNFLKNFAHQDCK